MRLATRADLPALAALERACFPGAPWDEASLHAELSRGFILLDPGHRAYAIGMVILDECELLRIGVRPEARRHGLGQAALEAFHAECARRVVARVLLEVRADNAAARRLYEAAGYAAEGTRKSYYPPHAPGGQRVDAVLYGRLL